MRQRTLPTTRPRSGSKDEKWRRPVQRRCCAGVAVFLLGPAAYALSLWRGAAAAVADPLWPAQRSGAHPSSFDGCGWRRPGAVLLVTPPRAGGGALAASMASLAGSSRRFVAEALPAGDGSPAFGRRLAGALARAAAFEAPVVVHGDARAPVAVDGVAVVAAIRSPRQALASFYAAARSGGDPPTVGGCAADGACAEAHALARRCSAQTLALCGYGAACVLGADGVASDAAIAVAVDRAASDVLLALPVDRLEADGYASLDALLPHFFRGLGAFSDAAPDRRRAGDADAWAVAASDGERAALRRICRADQLVYETAVRLYADRAATCAAAVNAVNGGAQAPPRTVAVDAATPFPTLAPLPPRAPRRRPPPLLAVEKGPGGPEDGAPRHRGTRRA